MERQREEREKDGRREGLCVREGGWKRGRGGDKMRKWGEREG
jgi:hypothetical protein